MADVSFERDVLDALVEQGGAVGALAKNEKAFRAAYAAFRKVDQAAFQAALKEVQLQERCVEICEWIRSKECIFICLALAGPPKPVDKPDPRLLAEAIVRITSDAAQLKALEAAVEKRDHAAFLKIAEANKIVPLIHFFCRWICIVRLRLICRVVCSPRPIARPSLTAELESAGKALRALLAKDGAFAAAAAASDAGDAKKLGAVIDEAGLRELCLFICEFFCNWRCVLGCLRLVARFPLAAIPDEVAEAYAFAQATQKLAANPAQLTKLSAAVGAGDAAAFTTLITELKLQRFALQLCHWICTVRCRFFCVIVCPPIQCALTAPTGCAAEQADPVGGLLFVPVIGTAGGSGTYTLDIQQGGDPPIAGVVMYPGGASHGTAPVINGELGRINTSSLSDSAYTITLNVHSGDVKSPVICTKTITFNLLKLGVYISDVALVPAVPSYFDETAELISGGHAASFGESLYLRGSAYVYGCSTRKIERYELRYARVAAPGPGPAQPATGAAIPADWPAANQLHGPLVYDPSKYFPCTRVGEAPTNLINDWGTMHVGAPAPGGSDYPVLVPGAWNSYNATGTPGGGRYSVLLIVTDTLGTTYYDLQRIWLDNWSVLCNIVKFQKPGHAAGTWEDIPNCTDILLSWGKLRIIGLAWDHLIDDAWPVTAPNDNFSHYGLSFYKQFGASESIPITPTADHPALAPTVRVPNTLAIVPTTANADLLAEWNLAPLDAGPKPAGGSCTSPLPPGVSSNALYRGCSCAYELSLAVNDTTIASSDGVHNPSVSQPIKIVNDI
jgi:hypothetical protein